MLLERLLQKSTPFCFLDTHAGAGRYRLNSVESQKKCEYEKGILKLFEADEHHAPEAIKRYLALIRDCNSSDQLLYYPGSPAIASHFMRSDDQMILCELHPDEKKVLTENIRDRRKKIAIHHLDGYLGMKAFLPPKEARGLVLIDPPFEVTDEFSRILSALKLALTHWRSGQYMIWYPIKNDLMVKKFEESLKKIASSCLFIHLALDESIEPGKLKSCGLALINPPWKLDEMLTQAVIPYLANVLSASITLNS